MINRSTFHCEGVRVSDGEKRLYMACSILEFEPDDHIPIRDYCTDLLRAAQDASHHFEKLDKCFSRLVECAFIAELQDFTDSLAVQCARQLLERLPEMPPKFLAQSSSSSGIDAIDDRYFMGGFDKTISGQEFSHTWERLQVTSGWSTNTIAMALLLGQGEKSCPTPRNLRRFVDTIGELLIAVVQISKEESKKIKHWSIVMAFLWTSWQRATMLFSW
jgi:hypothetical protein